MLDAGDAADVIDLVREEAGVGQTGRRFPHKGTLLDLYSRTVNTQRPLLERDRRGLPVVRATTPSDLARLFASYGARKRGLGLVDFDDLLLYWRALAAATRSSAPTLSGCDRPRAASTSTRTSTRSRSTSCAGCAASART